MKSEITPLSRQIIFAPKPGDIVVLPMFKGIFYDAQFLHVLSDFCQLTLHGMACLPSHDH